MKTWTKRIIGVAATAVVAFGFISLSCAKTVVKGTADTVYTADTAYAESRPVTIPAESLKLVEALQNSFRAISNTVLPSVVEIDVTETKTYTNPMQGFGWPFDEFFGMPRDNGDNKREYESKGLGSGVIVRRDGSTYYVLTNNHVAGSATKITVKLNDEREFEAKLIGADERQDIALISFESKDTGIPVAKLGDSDNVSTGDICMAMGAPLGYAQSVTQGIISATGRTEANMSTMTDYIQTDAAINQGNSGGPLVNIYGEVIGINSWIASQSGGSQGLGFAIPINNVKNSIDSFINKGKVVYGWVGVSLSETPKDFLSELGIEDVSGAFITQVFLNSPGYKYGLEPGDFIIEINGKKVKSVNQVIRDIGVLEAGSTANFTVIRNGQKVSDIKVKIEERNENSGSNNQKLFPGFFVSPLTEELREKLEIDDKKVKGVVISGVQERSPAASLRLQNGDVVTAVNGKPVKNIKEFYAEVAACGKSINFDVYSNGGTITTGTYKIQ